MDSLEVFIYSLANTWLQYRSEVPFTDEEIDEIQEKLFEGVELMSEIYENRKAEMENFE